MINIDWQKVGTLVPAIVQEKDTNEVLMLAYMNEEALSLSLKTGFAHYFSRTKNRIWKKGEESGNTQKIHSIKLDCDSDTLLLNVTQNGGIACHTGAKSCFFTEILDDDFKTSNTNQENYRPKYNILDELYHVILDRKLNADAQNSYVASLFKKGENAILKKIGEEATELALAIKDATKNNQDEQTKSDVVYECADLLFHSLVALSLHNIHPERVLNELSRRFGLSGIEEKNQRNVK
ncbi:Histidine biosynthesis bifunctional protein HisIE [Campylobacter majalis]|uniref:Histidine biosynthesis bifunctional protein HisIE n=1 Tax=Campylobacter majalis TaxID=2790656 RepID=A0ABM8Q7K3_9BACT|nr:bifunctional phosphoribosyl-AMP cyclohydrolase/phosphoribosyl-ATP diphosphatase HisIE [Campylobacter majalis]CAD7288946.1 Histidine biosynthesis bifunctional protein HisIE [Campylobacter majalis]